MHIASLYIISPMGIDTFYYIDILELTDVGENV